MGAEVTKATRGQSDLKAVHEREVFTAEKYKRDRPTGGKAHRPPHVFFVQIELFGLEVKICSPNVFGLGSVRVKGCSNQEVPL